MGRVGSSSETHKQGLQVMTSFQLVGIGLCVLWIVALYLGLVRFKV